jgi:hypothetical protein
LVTTFKEKVRRGSPMYGREEWDKSFSPTDFMLNIVGGLSRGHFRGFMNNFMYLQVNYPVQIHYLQ